MASSASSSKSAASSQKSTPSFVRRAASTGSGGRNKWYRGIPHIVPREEMQSLGEARHAYETRFMQTASQEQQKYVGEHIEQIRRTHLEKQAYFQQHSMPNASWMDLNTLTQERAQRQQQPAYFADVGGAAADGGDGQARPHAAGRSRAPAVLEPRQQVRHDVRNLTPDAKGRGTQQRGPCVSLPRASVCQGAHLLGFLPPP
eukprot:CAMPEP_0179094014 /NCGR_PEP_ID=MMETSP0796-20121207/43092_1 /TAXON_ID=73915 /ORGANISM="Pyrodinium bahamense, Strain pbaha01" /LENGTH=201 /DNA_ID=CAMNT_0020791673 /DNA_START=62 /DNA_END=662 /DNA_ORIENTATION=-